MASLFVGSLVQFYTLPSAAGVEELGAAVRRWWDDLQGHLEDHLQEPLPPVNDRATPAQFKLPSAALRGAKLLAAYSENNELPWPDDLPKSLEADPAWQITAEGDFRKTRFAQVLIPQCWLPGDFSFTSQQGMPDGNEMVLGSLVGLCQQLHTLNQTTVQLGPWQMEQLAALPSTHEGKEFLRWAELGIALLSVAADRAQRLGQLLIIHNP